MQKNLKIGAVIGGIFVLVAASMQLLAPVLFVRCSYAQQTSKAGTETIGIIGDKPQIPCAFADDSKGHTDSIVAENKKVDESGKEFIIVVFAAPLTIPTTHDGSLADGINNQTARQQLAKIFKAQQRQNALGKVGVKVLIANIGGLQEYGPYITENYLKTLTTNQKQKIAGVIESRTDEKRISALLAKDLSTSASQKELLCNFIDTSILTYWFDAHTSHQCKT